MRKSQKSAAIDLAAEILLELGKLQDDTADLESKAVELETKLLGLFKIFGIEDRRGLIPEE